MEHSTIERKSIKWRLRNPLKSVRSIVASDGNAGSDSTAGVLHPSFAQSTTTEVSYLTTKMQSTVEGVEIAARFARALIRKLPECVDVGNPPKMALSIVKTIIDIKTDIGDTEDSLIELLRESRSLLDDAVRRVLAVPDYDMVNQEIKAYEKKVEVETTNIYQLTEKLHSNAIQKFDYENYKKKMEEISKRINDATKSFTVDMQIIIAKMTSQMYDEQKKTSLKELNPSRKADYRTVIEGQNMKRELCTEGTRVKILNDITTWANDTRDDSPHIFYLTGQAGSGKTTIIYTIARRFEKGHPTTLGAAFLSSQQFEETRCLKYIIPTITYQLAHKCKSYADSLHMRVDNKSDAAEYDLFDQIEELLVGPWCQAQTGNLPTYLIIIDALDEIDEDGGLKFIRCLLRTINQRHLERLKFLITSRTHPRIVELCDTFDLKAICRLQDVPIEDAAADIGRYLSSKLPLFVGSIELAELTSQTNGLFIYAATAVRVLTNPRSLTYKEQMRKLRKLVSTPSSLASIVKEDSSPIDMLYQQILYSAFSKFADEDVTPRLRILFTLVCAVEPISTSVATTLMDDDDDLASSVLDDLHAVLYIQDGRIFWYHASFPDFLFSQNRSKFRIGSEDLNFWCDAGAQHGLLAASCFRVMMSDISGLRFNMGNITSSYLLDSDHIQELMEHVNNNITPVLKYCCSHWTRHLSSMALTPSICGVIHQFLQTHVLFWIEAMNLIESSSQCAPMLHKARQLVLNLKSTSNTQTMLTSDLLECANFATYFTASPAAKSTPHLYISCLATWKKESSLSKGWQGQFLRIPGFHHASAQRHLPLSSTKIFDVDDAVSSIAFFNDSSQIAAGLNNGYVGIWNATTGIEVKLFEGHSRSVRSVALSNDGNFIASGSDDTTVRVWDIVKGKCLHILKGHTNAVQSVAFSTNNQWIASGSNDTTIRIWNTVNGNTKKIVVGHSDVVNSVAFSHDCTWIASGSQDCSVRVWSTATGRELNILTGHKDVVTSVAISTNDSWIVSGSRDGSVQIWDAVTFDSLRTINDSNLPVISIGFSADSSSILVFGNWDFVVWNISTGNVFRVLQGRFGWMYAFALSSDHTRVISASRDGYVRVWNVQTSQTESAALTNDTTPITSLAISYDDTKIAFGAEDGSVHVWDVSIFKELQVQKKITAPITSVVFSQDGTKLAWVSGSKVWVWNTSRGVLLDHFEEYRTGYFISITFSTDGKLLGFFLNGSDIQLWDSTESAEQKTIHENTNTVLSVALSEDGQQLVSASMDNAVRRCTLSGENLRVMWGHKKWVNAVAFSSNASQIASGSSDMTVRIWDASTGSELIQFQGHTASVRTVSFSRNDAYVVSGSWDYSVRIWDKFTAKEVTRLRGNHTDVVNSISVSRNQESIVSGSRDGSVVLWQLEDPIWYIGEDNWIISFPSAQRLMWVPPDAHVIQRPNCRILSGKSRYSTVDFQQSEQALGPDWQNIYTPCHDDQQV